MPAPSPMPTIRGASPDGQPPRGATTGGCPYHAIRRGGSPCPPRSRCPPGPAAMPPMRHPRDGQPRAAGQPRAEGQPRGVAPTTPSVGAGPRARPGPGCRRSADPADGQPSVAGQPRGVAPTANDRLSLADVVGRFKSLTTRRYTEGVTRSGWTPYRGRVWQRNYYEHIIRDETSLHRIRAYIDANPSAWASDAENPEGAGKGTHR